MSKIRERREALGMSQQSLAEKVGVNQTAISQWERGISMPTLPKAFALAGALNCKVEDLYPLASGTE